ncbi:MAG: alanine/glycine:cation symporter family protein [Myxococcota bacterium]|nr:alanine/glycine:cation symporter family protein [Myxococcota bacterium]
MTQASRTGAPLGIDETIDQAFQPVAQMASKVVFYSVSIGGSELPLIVVWLIAGAAFFTLYLGFINIRGFKHAIRIVQGKEDDPSEPGEVSHFQALTAAVSGTVGVGNIAHVAVAVSVGGPGAAFWMVMAGFLGMASKFAECTLGVKYRQENPDGSISGGPMFFLDRGLARLGWPRAGRGLAIYYAICVAGGSVGVGMFQSNQAFVQFVAATGGEESFATEWGWLFGIGLSILVGLVIMGGIRSIARVTEKLVPVMAVVYIATALFVILYNFDRIPAGLAAIVQDAFEPQGMAGGVLGVVGLGFRRAAFSNEAGIGSSSIAHAAVKTREPLTQGFVAMLEPLIDTIIVCSITALVIVTAFEPGSIATGEVNGVELTSAAFEQVVSWFPSVLSVVVLLFAYSTLITWSYYGLEGIIYLIGPSPAVRWSFNLFYCACAVIGCTTTLATILEFSDAMIFAMAFANLIGLYCLAPGLRRDLKTYWSKVQGRDRGMDAPTA